MLIFSRLKRVVRSQGSGEFQDHSTLSMITPSWLVTVSAHAGRHIARQIKSMVRGLLCFLGLLKPEQVFHFNHPKKKEKKKKKMIMLLVVVGGAVV